MSDWKMGRVPPLAIIDTPDHKIVVDHDGTHRAVVKLGSVFGELRMATLPPESVGWSAKARDALARMYNNQVEGCCVIASTAHMFGVVTSADGSPVALATDREMHDQYVSFCGPGDRGCSITAVMDLVKTRGLVMSGVAHKIDGYVTVNNAVRVESQVGVILAGGLRLGISLPKAWYDAPDGGVWDVTSSRIVGGHDVFVFGYDTTGVHLSTWGGTRRMTWPAFQSKRWVEECYAQLAPDWYGSDNLAPNGIDAVSLKARLAQLGGGTVPDIDPVTPPVPVPPTPPVGGLIVIDPAKKTYSFPPDWARV